MKTSILNKTAILLAFLIAFSGFALLPKSAKAHTSSRSKAYWYLGFGFSPSYYGYRSFPSLLFSPYRTPGIQYSPAMVARSSRQMVGIINKGELKRQNWINAKNFIPPQIIPTPIPREPSLKAPEIETKKPTEL